MSVGAGFFFNKSCSSLFSWKSMGKFQQTLSRSIKRSGTGLHSGESFTVTISPEYAGYGRTFNLFNGAMLIPASIHFAATHSPLCTTLFKDGYSVRTVEHLLSALEAYGVDNCTIYVTPTNTTTHHRFVEVPIFDGSAIEWVEAIEQAGLEVARDKGGDSHEKMALFVTEPVHVQQNDSFLVALPSSSIQFTYGINFQQVPAIGCQWFSLSTMEKSFYSAEIASSRTFCIYEQVEQMHNAGLAKGGSLENAIVCSSGRGWLNPPLRFVDEPCRHKVLDLIGDFSLLAQFGSQGLPVAHIIAYKGGHTLHTDFLRRLLKD